MPYKQVPERLAAAQAGLKRFSVASPCKRGHQSERWVSSGYCIACRQEDSDKPHLIESRRRSAREYARQPHVMAQIKERNRLKRGAKPATRPEPEKCELCPRIQERGLALDHCHVTGAFRGWLCSNCNAGIGLLGDTLEALKRAVVYLEKATQCPSDT